MDAKTRHAGDIGRILKSVQDDLKNLRNNLTSGLDQDGGTKKKIEALTMVIDRAEFDLRAKAEAVLTTALSEQFTTLPSINREYQMSAEHSYDGTSQYGSYETLRRPRSATKPMTSRPTHSENILRRRRAEMVANPTTKAAREFLQERFGVEAPVNPKPREAVAKKGRLMTTKTAPTASPLPKINRVDPLAPPPLITGKDVEKGIYDLVSRGMLPSHVDLTPAFIQAPAPVLCGQVVLHPWSDQFVKNEPMVLGGFNMSTVKMNLINRTELPGTRELSRLKEQTPETGVLKTTTLEMPMMAKKLPPSDGYEGPVFQTFNGSAPVGPASSMIADDPRGYNELLDTFSLHQFIIRRGETLGTTPEFLSFKRKYSAIWGRIQEIIERLETLLGRFSVPIAYIDGNRVVLLSEKDHRTPTIDDLLGCIVNLDQVLTIVQIPGRRFKGSNARVSAAVALQSCFRGHVARNFVRKNQQLGIAACVIQAFWRMVLYQKETQIRIKNKILNRIDIFKQLQEEFQGRWSSIRERKRVVVHIPSISRNEAQRISLKNFVLKENAQLARLTNIIDANVEVILVTPFALSPDIAQYYAKLLHVGATDAEERFKIVTPENCERFPPHFSLSAVLRYSPRCLKRITNFVRGRDAYIVPGCMGQEDVNVAVALKIPVLGPDPTLSTIYTSKSGAKRIFASAEVNTPPAAYDLFDFTEIAGALSSLIFQHLDIRRWLVKIDDEFLGRGHALFDMSSVQFYESMKKERDRNPTFWFDDARKEGTIKRIMQEIVKLLPRAHIMHSDLYPDWESFMKTVGRVGCVIEAVPSDMKGSPSANILIEPNGTVQIQSTHDQIWTANFRYVGACFPQVSCHHEAVMAAAFASGSALYAKNIFGYFSLDFISFTDKQGLPRLWGVDINEGITDSAASYWLFNFICQGEYDSRDGHYYATPSSADDDRSVTTATPSLSDTISVFALPAEGRSSHHRRHYMWIDLIQHPNIAAVQYSVFFNLCRLKGVHFDLQEKVGTAFCLVDSFACGMIGLLTVARTTSAAIKYMTEALEFVQSQLAGGPGGRAPSDKYLPNGPFKDALMQIRVLLQIEMNQAKQQHKQQPNMVPF